MKLEFSVTLTGHVRFRFRPPQPGPIGLVLIQEENDVLVFKAILQPPLATDVVSREFSLSLAGAEPVVTKLPPTALEVPDLRAPQDTPFKLSLVDIDDAGNRSVPRVLEAVLKDTFPPPQPGELGILVTGEE